MIAFGTIVDDIYTFARALKESRRGEMLPTLVAARGGAPVAAASHDEVGELFAVAGTMASGYGADTLALILEGVFPLLPHNPLTKVDWEKGEAEELWLHHDGAARGWVTECQLVTVVSRDLQRSASAHSFRNIEGEIHWSGDAQRLQGTGVEQSLVDAFDRPMLDPAQVRDPGDGFTASADAPMMNPDLGRRSLDVGLTRVLDTRFTIDVPGGYAVFVFGNEEEAGVYRAMGLMDWQCLVCAD